MKCPACGNDHIVKNAVTSSSGKQNYLCRNCGRQFVENPQKPFVSQEKRAFIDRLLLERIPLTGIVRVVNVSQSWLQSYVHEKYENVSRQVEVTSKKKASLTIECDEMWSFVGHKKNKQWIWLALDRDTREIVGVYVGSRNVKGAKALWDSLPSVYRQCAAGYTDFWAAYGAIKLIMLLNFVAQHIILGQF